MAWFLALAVFAGFAPSFYLKWAGLSYPRPNPDLTLGMVVHGLIFTSWVILFVVQVSLVSAGRRDLHRTLGVFGLALGLVMIPVMYLTALWQVPHANQPPYTDPLTWTAIPMVGIPVFTTMLALGAREAQRDLQAHKRLMLSLMIMLAQPAIARLPISPPSVAGFAISALVSWLAIVPLLVWDMRTLGRLHWATKVGAGLYALVAVLQVFFLATPGLWSSFVVLLPGF